MRLRRYHVLGVAVALFNLFYAEGIGLSSSNDGSHYALIKSIVVDGRLSIDAQLDYTERVDYAEYDGAAYSDRAPGMGLLYAALLSALRPLESLFVPLQLSPRSQRAPDDALLLPPLMLLPALAGALGFVAFFGLLRELRVSPWIALYMSLYLALGTLAHRYSVLLYSHVFTMTLLLFSLWVLVRHRAEASRWQILAGALFGYAVISEFIVGLLAVGIALYFALAARRGLRPAATSLAWFAAGGCVALLVLGGYDWLCFGNPLSLPHFHHATFQEHHSLWTTFDLSAGHVARFALLHFFGSGPLTSVFASSILFFLLPVGLWFFLQEWRGLALGLLVGWALVVFFVCGMDEVGGADWDYRQMLAVMPTGTTGRCSR